MGSLLTSGSLWRLIYSYTLISFRWKRRRRKLSILLCIGRNHLFTFGSCYYLKRTHSNNGFVKVSWIQIQIKAHFKNTHETRLLGKWIAKHDRRTLVCSPNWTVSNYSGFRHIRRSQCQLWDSPSWFRRALDNSVETYCAKWTGIKGNVLSHLAIHQVGSAD